jgi:hypothetical protein
VKEWTYASCDPDTCTRHKPIQNNDIERHPRWEIGPDIRLRDPAIIVEDPREAPLYGELATYLVPVDLRRWFEPKLANPAMDPHGNEVKTMVALAKLAAQGKPLAVRIAGSPPVGSDLRLTPRAWVRFPHA